MVRGFVVEFGEGGSASGSELRVPTNIIPVGAGWVLARSGCAVAAEEGCAGRGVFVGV